MNTRRIEDEKKAKTDNIRKSSKNASLSCDEQVTQELGDCTFSTWFLKGELELGY